LDENEGKNDDEGGGGEITRAEELAGLGIEAKRDVLPWTIMGDSMDGSPGCTENAEKIEKATEEGTALEMIQEDEDGDILGKMKGF
jgi:hypothetical protein